VRQLRAAGTTILLTTHDMDEAQALADRVVVLSAGVVVADGPPAALGARDSAEARITFTLPDGAALSDLPVPAIEGNGAVVVAAANPTLALHELTDWALRRGAVLAGLSEVRPSLRTCICS
jgi:ABC-2 type transport system ATP-binding protein